MIVGITVLPVLQGIVFAVVKDKGTILVFKKAWKQAFFIACPRLVFHLLIIHTYRMKGGRWTLFYNKI
jgi:hypothetical protein